MREDDELEMLLGEIPHATPPLSLQIPPFNNGYHDNNVYDHVPCMTQRRNVNVNLNGNGNGGLSYHYQDDESINCKHVFGASTSPVTASGFPLTSDESNSSSSPPTLELLNSGYGIQTGTEASLLDRLDISRALSRMNIDDQCEQSVSDMVNARRRFEYSNTSPWFDHSFGTHMWYGSDFANTVITRNNLQPPVKFGVPNVPLSANNPNLQIGASSSSYSSNVAAQVFPPRMPYNNDVSALHNARNKMPFRGVDPIDREESLMRSTRNARAARGHNGSTKTFHQDKRPHSQLNGQFHNNFPFPLNRPWKFNSLADAQHHIYGMAKDQQGCRFLQKMFDDGTSLDLEIIFSSIIDHTVELMMSQFGNYLMQKLLDVCSEEQKMHILVRATHEPGELARISLNTYGTRVVQKLIETLNTRQQISMVVSALEPRFLSLIKTLNGSHVIKRCLECFPTQDSKFIFVAAAKYCVDIATHQHGCCALQNCIDHSTGEYRENFVAEISANGLLLAEDAYGNYVVQFTLEKIPYATSKLTSQFEGNYVNLSTQKFSSHVVEKCLSVCNEEGRAKIIHELLSVPCFAQLLQHPHANYVVQTALRVSKGALYDSLVAVILSNKAVSCNSPFSKRIYSLKLFKSGV